MAVAFDAFTAIANGTGNLSGTHTPVGTPRGVIVSVVGTVETDTVDTVTYGGSALAQVALSPITTGGATEQGFSSVWFLGTSIPTGAQTVAITVTGAGAKVLDCVTLTAATDTAVQDTTTISSSSVTNPTATLSLGGNSCFCMEAFYTGASDPANFGANANWTVRREFDFGTDCAGGYTYDIVGTTDVTMGWTQTTEEAAGLGIAIKESAAAGLSIPVAMGQYRRLRA